jgi:hypothetical protein
MKFETLPNMTTKELVERMFIDVQNEDEYLIGNEISDNIIDGFYATSTNTRDLVFNEERKVLEVTIVKKSIVIPFSIDVENKIMDIWSTRQNSSRLINKLGILLNHNVIIEAKQIDLVKIAENLEGDSIKIGKIKIDNYPIEEDIIAECSFSLKNHSMPVQTVKKYSKNLIQLSLIISDMNGENLSMLIYKSGSVVIYKSRDEISLELLDAVRKICTQ